MGQLQIEEIKWGVKRIKPFSAADNRGMTLKYYDHKLMAEHGITQPLTRYTKMSYYNEACVKYL